MGKKASVGTYPSSPHLAQLLADLQDMGRFRWSNWVLEVRCNKPSYSFTFCTAIEHRIRDEERNAWGDFVLEGKDIPRSPKLGDRNTINPCLRSHWRKRYRNPSIQLADVLKRCEGIGGAIEFSKRHAKLYTSTVWQLDKNFDGFESTENYDQASEFWEEQVINVLWCPLGTRMAWKQEQNHMRQKKILNYATIEFWKSILIQSAYSEKILMTMQLQLGNR